MTIGEYDLSAQGSILDPGRKSHSQTPKSGLEIRLGEGGDQSNLFRMNCIKCKEAET